MTADIADLPAVRTGNAGRASGPTRRTTGMSRPSPGRRNPYLVPRLAVVSFSGGRTGAYMLKHIVDAHGGGIMRQSGGVKLYHGSLSS